MLAIVMVISVWAQNPVKTPYLGYSAAAA